MVGATLSDILLCRLKRDIYADFSRRASLGVTSSGAAKRPFSRSRKAGGGGGSAPLRQRVQAQMPTVLSKTSTAALPHHYICGNEAGKALCYAQLARAGREPRGYAEAASMLDAALKRSTSCARAPTVCAPSWRSAASKPWWPLSCAAPSPRSASAPSGPCASWSCCAG
jgi:hypothetical protein